MKQLGIVALCVVAAGVLVYGALLDVAVEVGTTP
jgi:hypothetical protein